QLDCQTRNVSNLRNVMTGHCQLSVLAIKLCQSDHDSEELPAMRQSTMNGK
ncbi:unnamed protein product, partial [Ceratitis capitata]